MTPSQAKRDTEHVRDLLDRFAADAHRTLTMLDNALAGYPSHGDGPSSGISDPTPNQALHPDAAATDLIILGATIPALVHHAHTLDDIRRRWLPATASGSCGNPQGCPTRKHAAPGRKGLCEACSVFLRRHGRDRTPTDVRTMAAAALGHPAERKLDPDNEAAAFIEPEYKSGRSGYR